MKKAKLLLGAALITAACSSAAFADVKVGVVDLGQVFAQAPQVKALKQKLTTQFAGQQQKIVDLQNKLRNEFGKLSSPDAAKMTASDKTTLQNQVTADQTQLQRLYQDYQTQFSAAQLKASSDLLNSIDTTAKAVATSDKLDLVLAKAAVIYSPNTVDITDQIIKQLPSN